MSNDLLIRALEQNARLIPSLRSHAPLYAAIANVEQPSDRGAVEPCDTLLTFLGRRNWDDVIAKSTEWGTGGYYAIALFTESWAPVDARADAYQAFGGLAQRVLTVLGDFPDSVLRRLGFDFSFSRPSNWVRMLFHFAWHFPEHFAGGAGRRTRLLGQAEHRVSEDDTQLWGPATREDRFPGVIFAQFSATLDLVTATEYAIDLMRCSLKPNPMPRLTDQVREQFRAVHGEFVRLGRLASSMPSHPTSDHFDVRVLLLTSSFQTPPAHEWADLRLGGAVQEVHWLSRLNAMKECCVVRGMWRNDFNRLANRAGDLLPAWPVDPNPPLRQDVFAWDQRVQRRRELAGQQFFDTAPDGDSQGEPIPTELMVEQDWEATRPPHAMGGLVTDHRGNVERWIGFVFYILKQCEPDVIARVVPEWASVMGGTGNAVLTLRGMNMFAASARAIELAGLIPSLPPAPPLGKPTGRPPDSRKREIVNYVRELREKHVLWKDIPGAVFKKFKVKYTSETLRGYLKSG